MANGRERSTVKFFNRAKKFGFIVSAFGGRDIYIGLAEVDRCGLPRDPRTGDRITFVPWGVTKGNRATQLEIELGTKGKADG